MAIKNYTSKISSTQSMGEIQQVLAEHGASKVMIDYENGKPISISFLMMISSQPAPFRLNVNVDGLLRAMQKDKRIPQYAATPEQAERTAWRNKLEWLRLQMAEIQTEQASLGELLLGYAVTSDGRTAHERMQDGDHKFLLET